MLTEKRIRDILAELSERMAQEKANYIEATVTINPYKNTALDAGPTQCRIRIAIEAE